MQTHTGLVWAFNQSGNRASVGFTRYDWNDLRQGLANLSTITSPIQNFKTLAYVWDRSRSDHPYYSEEIIQDMEAEVSAVAFPIKSWELPTKSSNATKWKCTYRYSQCIRSCVCIRDWNCIISSICMQSLNLYDYLTVRLKFTLFWAPLFSENDMWEDKVHFCHDCYVSSRNYVIWTTEAPHSRAILIFQVHR